MSDPINVLFLCTGNSARSIMAESILRREGQGRFVAYSAGSHPSGQVNPLAIETLSRLGYPIDGLRSKSWDQFDAKDSPTMHVVITVCDNAAGESCPVWPGHPARAHWGIEDPSSVTGTRTEQLQAFATALRYLKNRVTQFVSLPIAKLTDSAALRDIGRGEGASSGVVRE